MSSPTMPFVVSFSDGEFAGRAAELKHAVGLIYAAPSQERGMLLYLGTRLLWTDGKEKTEEGNDMPTVRKDRDYVEKEIYRRMMALAN